MVRMTLEHGARDRQNEKWEKKYESVDRERVKNPFAWVAMAKCNIIHYCVVGEKLVHDVE